MKYLDVLEAYNYAVSETIKEPIGTAPPMNRLRYFSDFLFLGLVATRLVIGQLNHVWQAELSFVNCARLSTINVSAGQGRPSPQNSNAATQWRRQTRGVGCIRTPCHEDS